VRERDAIAACLERVPVADALRGPGDDAAVLAPPGGNLVWATDFVIEGRHFSRAWSSLDDAAYKAVARNASDLAAMGAEPVAFLAAVAIPDTEPATIDAIANGFREAAVAFGLPVVGGDLSRSDTVIFAVSVLGRVEGRGIGRDGARPGDVVAVTGALGATGAGLGLLQRASAGDTDAQAILDRFPNLLGRHRRGVARLAAGRALLGVANAAIDLSDGLGVDAGRIAEASGVTIRIDPALLPVDDGVAVAAAHLGVSVDALVAHRGDDYELLATLPADQVDAVRARIAPLPLTVVGSVAAGPPQVTDLAGAAIEGGHDHFA
jgi:thiamine-monophosphate kinase